MSSCETTESIARWAEETFGPAASLTALLDRAALELDEAREAAAANASPQAIGHELADVAILLHCLAAQTGQDLSALVNEKMRINRARRWTRAGDGTGRHIG